MCCAHFLKELNGIEENYPEQTWATKLKELLLVMKSVKDNALGQNKDAVSYYHLHKFDKQHYETLKLHMKKIHYQKVPKKTWLQEKDQALNLICRLEKYKESVCLFIKNLCVPIDNNQAERTLSMMKIKTKVSDCFQSEEGAQKYLTIIAISEPLISMK